MSKIAEQKALEAYPKVNPPYHTSIEAQVNVEHAYKREGYIQGYDEAMQDYFNEDSFDYQSFKAEAAKDILCAIISCPIIKDLKDDKGNLIPFEKFAATKVAIDYADELIKQLKEKEEK